MTDTTKSKCTHYPRCLYTHSEKSCDLCCIGCDKPGIGSASYDLGDNIVVIVLYVVFLLI